MTPNNFKTKTINGISWVMFSQVLTVAISFVITAILARLLTTSDFGLIGMILVFTGFAQLISKAGFTQALVQRVEVEDRHYHSAFWLNVGIGALMTLALCLAAPLIASFYKEPQLVPLTRVISLVFLLGPANLVQRTILQRNMNFRRVGMIRVLSTLFSGIIATVLALAGFGVWSLVAMMLMETFFEVALMWLTTSWYPKFSFDWGAIRDLWSFTVNFTGYTMVDYWARSADNLLLGRFMGSAALGIYTRAYSLMLLPVSQIITVVTQVMHSALSSIQTNIAQVKRVYLMSVASIALISIPMMLGMMVVAEPFILTVYGPKWAEVIPILQFLCIVGLLRSITLPGKWIFQSQGRVGIMFRWETIKTVVTLVGFAVGIWLGRLDAFVLILTGITVVLFPIDIILPLRVIQLGVMDFLKPLARITLAGVVMSVSVYLLDLTLFSRFPDWLQLALDILSGAGIYFAALQIMKDPTYFEWLKIGRDKWQVLNRKSPRGSVPS